MNLERGASPDDALNRLIQREEVLQICYWYQGEGFGDIVTARDLQPFLNSELQSIVLALSGLAEQEYLEAVNTASGSFGLTRLGKKEGGRLFAESFADFQKGGHGECDTGCCDDDDHAERGDERPHT